MARTAGLSRESDKQSGQAAEGRREAGMGDSPIRKTTLYGSNRLCRHKRDCNSRQRTSGTGADGRLEVGMYTARVGIRKIPSCYAPLVHLVHVSVLRSRSNASRSDACSELRPRNTTR